MENPYFIDPIEEYERFAEHLGMQQTRTIKAKKAFLKEYRDCRGNVTATCERAGVSRKTFYNWRDTDSYFRELLPIIGVSYEVDDTEGTLRQLILRGDGPSVRHFLRKHHPRYRLFKPKRAGIPKGYSRDEQGRFTKDLPKNKVQRRV